MTGSTVLVVHADGELRSRVAGALVGHSTAVVDATWLTVEHHPLARVSAAVTDAASLMLDGASLVAWGVLPAWMPLLVVGEALHLPTWAQPRVRIVDVQDLARVLCSFAPIGAS